MLKLHTPTGIYETQEEVDAYWEHHKQTQRYYLALEWWPKLNERTKAAHFAVIRRNKHSNRKPPTKAQQAKMSETYDDKFESIHGMRLNDYRESDLRKADQSLVERSHGVAECDLVFGRRKDGGVPSG